MNTFYRLLGFLRPYKRGLAISWVLASLAMVMSVALPALTGRAVEAIRKGAADLHGHPLARAHDRHTLLVLSLVILGVVLARWGFMYWRRMIAGRVSLAVEYDLRERIYGQLQRLELGFFDHQQTGQLMSRATVDLAGRALLPRLRARVHPAVDPHDRARRRRDARDQPRLGLLALAAVPFVVVISYRYGRRARPAIQETQQRIAELTADAEENISGVRVVKAFAREDRAADALSQNRRTRLQPGDGRDAPGSEVQPDDRLPAPARPRGGAAGRRQIGDPRPPHARPVHRLLPVREHADHADARARRDAQPRPARHRLRRAHLPAARPRAAPHRRAERAGAAARQRARAAARRDAPLRGPARRARRERARGSGARRSHKSGRAVLRDIDLDVPAGRTVALVGPTGSGKTSLVALISRLYDPVAGEVLLDGADVREVTVRSVRAAVAVVSDDPFLFSASVAENIAYARPDAPLRRGRTGRARRAGARVHLAAAAGL